MNLIEQYKPIYFFDHREDLLPINYTDLALQNQLNVDNSVIGIIKENMDGSKYLYYFMAFEQDNGMTQCCSKRREMMSSFDLEHVVVHVDENGNFLKMLFCSREWYWTSKPIIEGLRPHVYLSYHSHIPNHRPGTISRFCGVLRDECLEPDGLRDVHVVNMTSELIGIHRIRGAYHTIPMNLQIVIMNNIKHV
jgi:hypothetical protein